MNYVLRHSLLYVLVDKAADARVEFDINLKCQ
jgi:hypothetical protein